MTPASPAPIGVLMNVILWTPISVALAPGGALLLLIAGLVAMPMALALPIVLFVGQRRQAGDLEATVRGSRHRSREARPRALPTSVEHHRELPTGAPRRRARSQARTGDRGHQPLTVREAELRKLRQQNARLRRVNEMLRSARGFPVGHASAGESV